jgi:chorismate mutase/prephenate dehydratase
MFMKDQPMAEDKIIQLRDRIDRLDYQIVELLTERAANADEIGRLKRLKGMPVYDASRETALMSGILAQNKGPLPDSTLRRIYVEIISACRELQGPTRISFLGPEATFTHRAGLEYFGGSCNFAPADSIKDVFKTVENGHADFGVVPVENSTEGSVGLTLDQLAVSELKICGEIFLRISHSLMSGERDLSRIKQVLSHPQALAQCGDWLSRRLPGIALVQMPSTAAAARRVAEERANAAVGSEMLAKLHGLNVLARDIQDLSVNLTRFLVLGSQDPPKTGRDRTSLLFATLHRPGALRMALAPLAEQGINISRIESRPSRETPWEYIFFLDLEGHLSDEDVECALEQLTERVSRLKILGSYPIGELMGKRSELGNIIDAIAAVGESPGQSRVQVVG